MKSSSFFNETFVYCIIVLLLNSTVLYYYHFILDPYHAIERYYFQKNKIQFYVFKLAYTIIFLSVLLAGRYLSHQVFTLFLKRFTN